MTPMSPARAFALAALATLSSPVWSGDPVISDNRILTDERRMAILETKLSSLRMQVGLLEDRRAIERLQQAYTHYLSAGRPRDAAALFSDGSEASIEFAQMGVYVGKARIEAFLARWGTLAPGQAREMPTLQGVVTVAPDGRTAKARWRSIVMGGLHGQDGEWMEGPYENEYVKENGVWKIRTRHWFTTIRASYDKGWHRGALPIEGPLADLPPDRAPSIVYSPFPKFFLPPYHYANPVTGKPVGWDR